jgi:hypothetical protein
MSDLDHLRGLWRPRVSAPVASSNTVESQKRRSQKCASLTYNFGRRSACSDRLAVRYRTFLDKHLSQTCSDQCRLRWNALARRWGCDRERTTRRQGSLPKRSSSSRLPNVRFWGSILLL